MGGVRAMKPWLRIVLTTSVMAGGSLVAAGLGTGYQLTGASPSPRVLLVGTFNGIPGGYSTIQAAVDAAAPGDWILVAPGDYKESGDHTSAVRWATPGAVTITTPDIHIVGMDRNSVIVDGTKPGPTTCSSNEGDQDFGVVGPNGALGRNGILVWKADNVTVENLTVCNFLAGKDSSGNAIWWDGDAGSGKIGGHGFYGAYLSATSTYFGGESTASAYGIFSSNWSGGTWEQTYASNFNDSGYYIGACQQVCNQVVDHAWAENNALGYSGSNSGGQLVVENSQFDGNQDGFDTNSQNGDNPPPQNGSCPNGAVSPITHTTSCWVFMDNYVHDNNNPNVPAAGSASAGPVGTGMSLSGARNDTVMDNTFANNGAWGTIFVPYPDNGSPCTGGVNLPGLCLYDDSGNALIDNTYSHNGFFNNPTNGDFADLTLTPGLTNCFRGNVDTGAKHPSTSPPALQILKPKCGLTEPPDANPLFLAEAACDSQISIGPVGGNQGCLPGSSYPRQTKVDLKPLPSGLPTMPNPCVGAPANAWCPNGQPAPKP